MSSRLRCHCPSQPVAQQYVPAYTPPCCPAPTKRDPRRNSPYCPSTRSFSEPLSHAEYLRRLKENNTAPISSTNALVQYGEGEYKKTLWMEGLVGGACCPAVPLIPAAQTTQDAGLYTEAKGAAAAAIVGINDEKGVPESLHTLQKQGQAIFSQTCPGFSCQESQPEPPTPPPPPPVINFSYLAVQRGATGNFKYHIYNTLTNEWTYVSDSGLDGTYTFVEAGFVGNQFFTVFTNAGMRYFQIIDLFGEVFQPLNPIPITQFGFTSSYFYSNVLFAYINAISSTSINITRYNPITELAESTQVTISSFPNFFVALFYNLLVIRYRSSESPLTVNHALWPLTQTAPSASVYTVTSSPGIFTGLNLFGSFTAGLRNSTHFAWESGGQFIIPTIDSTNVTALGNEIPSGYGPINKGRQLLRVLRGGYNEWYLYDFDAIANSTNPKFIYMNPLRRLAVGSGVSFSSYIQNTYLTGLTSLPSNSQLVTEQNVNTYTNAISLDGVVTPGNYTDISGSVVGGRTFSLSRIAYNTYYQEPTFGYITGNSDNPVTTVLSMSNGSTWIQGSGSYANTRGTMTVSNLDGSYSLNKFFTVETMIPILEPNDSVIDLPATSLTTTERSWNVVQQQFELFHSNSANSVFSQGPYGMIIKPRNTTSVVRQIQFRANIQTDSSDPMTFTLEGSNDNGTTYTTIVANANTNIGNAVIGSRLYIYYSAVFANSTAYSQYRLTFPTLRVNTSPTLRIQKVQFLAAAPGGYLIDGSVNASITLNKGQTYEFKVNAPNDIFWIQTVPAPYSSANVYNTGVTNNGCKSSILRFAVPAGAPATLYYVSQTDPTKTGTINIVNSGAPAGNISGTWWAHMNSSTVSGASTFADIWFTIENPTQWGTSAITKIQDTRPTSAVTFLPYRYVVGVSGQNYLLGKMFVVAPFNPTFYTASEITTIIQRYVQNLNLFNTFQTVSFPKLYTHITPTTAYTLPSWSSSVMTAPNGFNFDFSQCVTFTLTAYNDIQIRRIGSYLQDNNNSQRIDIYYRNGGVSFPIDTTNGWTQLTFDPITPTALNGINNNIRMFPPVNNPLLITVLAGQTFGFCIRSSSNLIVLTNTVGSTEQFYENNDFRITTGDVAGFSGTGGPTMPFTLSTTPRSFAGLVEAQRTVNPTQLIRATTFSVSNFQGAYNYGEVISILGNEVTPRRFEYTIPNLFVSQNAGMVLYNNNEYSFGIETSQYAVNLRIIRSVSSGDLVVPIRTNMICLPSTYSLTFLIGRMLGYVYVSATYQGTQRDYVIVRITDGVIVAQGTDPNFSEAILTTGSKLIRLNSNGTITMFRNGTLETYTANTFTNIARMRSDIGLNDTLFAYSTARALALTDSGYTIVTFPTPLTAINSTILANNYLTLIQLNPLRINVVSPSATLYTYSLEKTTTLMRRRNTDTSMMVHVQYPSTIPGPDSTVYTFRMTDSYGDGWNGSQMQIRQGTTVIATIGPTFTSGFGPVNITVTLVAGQSYNLFWVSTNPATTYPEEVGVSILNPSGTTIYSMPFNSQALMGTTLYTFTAQSFPTLIPENLYVTFDTTTNQFYTNTATIDTVSNVVGNFIYQP